MIRGGSAQRRGRALGRVFPGAKEAAVKVWYTLAILCNGRELENVGASVFGSEREAAAAAVAELDWLCPAGSPGRRYYRVEVREVAGVPAEGVV